MTVSYKLLQFVLFYLLLNELFNKYQLISVDIHFSLFVFLFVLMLTANFTMCFFSSSLLD
jgi:hypothetical protein